jgi:hypothetical protein
MRRPANLLLAGLGLTALACSDRGSTPTGPQLGPPAFAISSCDVSGARNLANQLFPNGIKQIAQDSLGVIQNAGAGTPEATNAGFGILELVSTYGPNAPQLGSDLANAILPCMNVGSSPTDFTAALGPNGAFAVRGGSSTDAAAAVSHDVAWGMEPPLNTAGTRLSWNAITVPANTRLLAYGAPITAPGFTAEQQVGTIFDWFTIPTLTFNPGVVVGTCIVDNGPQYLIQHNALGEIVPSATTSFCPVGVGSLTAPEGWGPAALAQRVFNFFSPRPLLATALGTRPPGGSIGSLSPNVAVNPGQITLAFPKQVADGKTNQIIKFKDGTTVSVTVEPAGGTNLDGAVVELTAVANLGAPVIPTGNTAVTNDGVATFPNLSLNKAGGYRLVAKITGFGQNNASGFNIVQATSNGFNLKQSK